MMIVRASRQSDIEQLLELAQAVKPSMTTMPVNYAAWEEILFKSTASFQNAASTSNELYLLVMEDRQKHKVVGTSAIYPKVGTKSPFYTYKLSTLVTHSHPLDRRVEMKLLTLTNDYTGCTELGTLYLHPAYRKNANGQFLSRCRYLLIADFVQRFADKVIAEMRGYLDKNGKSPFWEHIGRKFFAMDFCQADQLCVTDGTQFITDLAPKYPIYTDLLSKAAREVIGKVHESSEAAVHLLYKEGFQYRGYVDIFDGGPTVECPTEEIFSVSKSVRTTLSAINEVASDNIIISSNGKIDDYRVVMGKCELTSTHNLVINDKTAEALKISSGESLRHIDLM